MGMTNSFEFEGTVEFKTRMQMFVYFCYMIKSMLTDISSDNMKYLEGS